MHLNGHVADEIRNDRVPSSDGDIPDAGKGAGTCIFKTSYNEIENAMHMCKTSRSIHISGNNRGTYVH
jgi:hypothetical protein